MSKQVDRHSGQWGLWVLVGILGTALLLLSYYLFLTRCGLLFFFCRTGTTTRIVSVQDDDGQPPRRSSSGGGGGGLDGAAIRRTPRFRYGRRSKCSSSEECAVCLADLRDGERLRLLPACLHAFHIDCIDAWLQSNANCPLCRAPVVAIADDDHQLLCIADATSSSGAEAAPAAATSGFLLGRRSLSMDSSSCAHKHCYLALILQQHNSNSISIGEEEDAGKVGEGGSSITSSRRLRRSFFSFSHSHSYSHSHSRGSSILPL
ncbi:hypothetical protein HU200_062173 [Digitaria exilis]|uniref:RING-type E3 ubiquitin transferase n=1 Tax=Digitaria exilis TaxID=1010633 RepID=A0A835DYY5_9POAL|nr:hypothetical protein HU200_062173 [Digitaria exilis]